MSTVVEFLEQIEAIGSQSKGISSAFLVRLTIQKYKFIMRPKVVQFEKLLKYFNKYCVRGESFAIQSK